MSPSDQIDYLIKVLPSFFTKRPKVLRDNVPFKEYTEWRSVNASLLKEPTPAHMLHYMTKEREETAALINGQLLHAAVFEPDTLEHISAILPSDAPKKPSIKQRSAKKPSQETKDAIAWWDDFNLQTAGKMVVDQDGMDSVLYQRDAIFRHHFARQIIEALGKSEASIEVWDEENQVMRKSRYDRLPGSGAEFLLDVKTTRHELHPWAILGEVRSRGYHLQAKSYIDCLKMASGDERQRFFFIFVRNEAPYIARVWELQELLPAPQLLSDAARLLYANETTQPGRLPMFCNAAREFIQRVQEKHKNPLGAWEAFENEGPQLLDAIGSFKN